jgi:D-tyrosyl-tRNA(Tyr) deacylase
VRIVLQRVSRASVEIAGDVVGQIGPGVALLVGFTHDDDEAAVSWMAEKVVGLRIFEDDEGKMNRSLEEAEGGVLVVSQFTLYGDVRKGRRPSFVDAAGPDLAELLYDTFLARLEMLVPGRVQSGQFGASMAVSLVNDGPVTLILERPRR